MAKKITMLLVLISLVCFVGCQKKDGPDRSKAPPPGSKPIAASATKPGQPQPPGSNAKSKANAVTSATAYAKGTSVFYFEFVKTRRTPPVNFDTLAQLYDKNLQKYVQEADAWYGSKLDGTILKALAEGKKGVNAPANWQTAEKSIQRAFLMKYYDSLAKIAKDEKADKFKEVFVDAAPVVRAISQRRGNWAGVGEQYTENFQLLYSKFMSAVKTGDDPKIKQMSKLLRDFTDKMVLLSVYYELAGLEKTRGKDNDKASEKIVEAYLYYLSVQPSHKARNPEGAKTVVEQLAQTYDKVDCDLVQKLLKVDFEAEVRGLDPALLGM